MGKVVNHLQMWIEIGWNPVREKPGWEGARHISECGSRRSQTEQALEVSEENRTRLSYRPHTLDMFQIPWPRLLSEGSHVGVHLSAMQVHWEAVSLDDDLFLLIRKSLSSIPEHPSLYNSFFSFISFFLS